MRIGDSAAVGRGVVRVLQRALSQGFVECEQRVDPAVAVAGLADLGFERIHCEGGPSLLGRLIAAGLVDELCLTIAPLLLGATATRLLSTDLSDPVGWDPVHLRAGGRHLFARYARRP